MPNWFAICAELLFREHSSAPLLISELGRETVFLTKVAFVFAEYQSIQAVQASMILSTIFCCVAFLVFILQLFRLKQGERFVLTSIIQLLSCEWFFNACEFNDYVKVEKGKRFPKEWAARVICTALEVIYSPAYLFKNGTAPFCTI